MALAGSSLAQAPQPYFNVDVGQNGAFPTPSSAFSAATGQAGFWNARSAAIAGPVALTDIHGVASPISATISGGLFDFEFNALSTQGDAEKLLDDIQDLGTSTTWTIGPMPAGLYRLTVYAWAPDVPSWVTNVELTGGANGVMPCGNSVGFNGFVLGQTHVQDTVQLAAGENLVFRCTPGSGLASMNGFQIEPYSPAPVTYCTAKVNSLGCTPSIGATGVSSATASSGFGVDTYNVVNNKPGIYIYGNSGRTAVPLSGGLRCVNTPLRQPFAITSGGNPPPNDCSGTYAFNFNAWMTRGPDHALVAGQTVWGQYWSRDPQSSFRVGLTSAVEFAIGP